MKNKRGDKVISIYWFVILLLVAGAMVYMVSVVYGGPYDVRKIEASLLTDKIADCMASGGRFVSAMPGKLNSDNLLQECHINFNNEEYSVWNNDQFYVEINVYFFGTKNPKIPTIKAGNFQLKDFCGQEGKTLSLCLDRSFYVLENQGNQAYEVNIISIVRKTEKNAV